MKQIDLTGVVLNPAAHTLDFSALAIDPRTVLAVLHEPTNRFIFAAGRTGLGYTSIAGAVMTLALDTSDLAAGPLTGFRDDGADVATDTRLEACRALLATGNATLSNLSTGLGTPADVAPGTDAAAGSLIAKVTRLLGTQSGIATVLAAIRDRLPAALVGGRLSVDGSGVTQPISAAALPLPAGAAQDATLTARLGTLGQKTMAASTPVAIASDQGAVPIQGGNATAVKTDGSATTQPVSAASLPLPAGAATSAAQTTSNAALGAPADAAYTGAGSSTIVGALKGLYAALMAATPAGTNLIGKVGIDQTTAGTTNGVVVNGSALPTGAATAANQSSEIAALGSTGDAAYAGAGASSIIAALKGIYAALLLPAPAGGNLIGKVNVSPATSGGLSLSNYYAQGTGGQGQVVKAASGQVFRIHAFNTGTAWAFLKMFNKATAPTLGTDPAVAVHAIPPGGTINLGSADLGDAFSVGIYAGLYGDAPALGGAALNAANTCGYVICYA